MLITALGLQTGIKLHVNGQALTILMARLFGTQTHLSGPELVVQASTSEILIDV
jgi:hypothetical protein